MTEHDVLVGFRLRLFSMAEELGNVSEACRVMGVDRSTSYRLEAKVDALMKIVGGDEGARLQEELDESFLRHGGHAKPHGRSHSPP